jgi:anthranilate phosphoribosyltransferase
MDILINHINADRDLDQQHVDVAVAFLLDESANVGKKVAFLEGLAAKGETAEEIAFFVSALLAHAIDPGVAEMTLDGPTIDVCGTGGDKLNLFNVSTTSMFVIASGGAVVTKHGNRGITSKSGGADVLEALGIRIDLPPEGFRHCLVQAGVGFLFAPQYHPAFKAVVPVRKVLAERGRRSIFNLIGPLLNPASPQCQLVGVMENTLVPTFAEILQRLGRESVWAVNGSTADGRSVDEVSLLGPTRICKAGSMQDAVDEEIHPADFDLPVAELADLQGGDAAENAAILTAILDGSDTGPKRDMILLNAAAGLACAGLADTVGEGIEQARTLIESGKAYERLVALQEASNA